MIEKALNESERSKSVFLSHLPGLAYRCNYDHDWTMQYVSEGCFNLTGYPPESLLYNRDCPIMISSPPNTAKPCGMNGNEFLQKGSRLNMSMRL
jgi:PAS domain-containing protein